MPVPVPEYSPGSGQRALGKDVIRRKDGGLWAGAVQCHVYDDQVV